MSRTLLKAGNLVEVRDPHQPDIIYGPSPETLRDQRPLDYIMNWMDKRRNNTYSSADRILILQASTGSGKSTILPTEIYHRFFSREDSRNICCTQPRVITSIDIPNTVLKYHTREALDKTGYRNRTPLELGKNIGYQTGALSKKPIRGIIFMTIGVLVQQLNIMSDTEIMDRYLAIIIDEVHERSISTDDALYTLKRFVIRNAKNKDCPFLVVMSATFDVWKFADYLLSDIEPRKRYDNIIMVKGFSYPITDIWPQYESSDYIQSAIDLVANIHEQNAAEIQPVSHKKKLEEHTRAYKDILIFTAGASQIRKLKKKLNDLNTHNKFCQKYPLLPVELTRDVVEARGHEYNSVFNALEKLKVEVLIDGKMQIAVPTRRVIISTNVAETGITLHTLRYVIDTGWFKSNEFNPLFAVDMLVTKPAVQHMAMQRRGRVGREIEGSFYPIYPKEVFDKMQREQFPDIIKNEITLNLLSFIIREVDPQNLMLSKSLSILFAEGILKGLGISTAGGMVTFDITNLDLLDRPSMDSMHHSLQKLYTLGAIDADCRPTAAGFIMNRFRFLSIENIKMILSGYAWGACITDLVTIACILETGLDTLVPETLATIHRTALQGEHFALQGMDGESTLYILADDFIRGLLIFYEFQTFLSTWGLSTSSAVGFLKRLQEWSESLGLSIKALHDIVTLREEVIEMLAFIGFNPYANQAATLANNRIDPRASIKQLKLCIFEGYKLNLAIWMPTEKRYYTRGTHLPVVFGGHPLLQGPFEIAKYGDTNPHFIMYHTLMLKPTKSKELYEAHADAISVVDGFIPLDVNFDTLI